MTHACGAEGLQVKEKSLSQPCYHRKIKKERADRESNPGLLRDKQRY